MERIVSFTSAIPVRSWLTFSLYCWTLLCCIRKVVRNCDTITFTFDASKFARCCLKVFCSWRSEVAFSKLICWKSWISLFKLACLAVTSDDMLRAICIDLLALFRELFAVAVYILHSLDRGWITSLVVFDTLVVVFAKKLRLYWVDEDWEFRLLDLFKRTSSSCKQF